MQKHSIENLRLIAYGKFNKIVTSWTDKILYTGLPFRAYF